MAGRTVDLKRLPDSIVVLQAPDVEILHSIGAGEQIANLGEYCNYPLDVAKKPVVASGADANLEKIIALHPDAVVMGAMAQTSRRYSSNHGKTIARGSREKVFSA